MCHLAGVSRAGYYRQWQEVAPDEEETEVRSLIQTIVLEHRRRYGILRVTAELRRRGRVVNHKRVERIMREDNLLAIVRRKFILTTDSAHDQPVYMNLAARMTLSGINQLWITDITYIRLRGEFVYLAVVLDRYSRKAIGWSLDRRLCARIAVAALQRAMQQRQPPPGVVVHSDRGIQFACAEFQEVMQAHQMVGSMSRPANPYDNAACESFIKTLKREEIYCSQYKDIDDLRVHLSEFIDAYYNQQRLHSALGYKTPEEFERDLPDPAASSAAATTAQFEYFQPKPNADPAAAASG